MTKKWNNATKEEVDESILKIERAVASINQQTKVIKRIDEKLKWNKVDFKCDPYEGMTGNWRGD